MVAVRRWRWFAAASAVSGFLVAVSAVTGVPGGARVLGAYLDVTRESNLPTWWSTALLTAASAGQAAAVVIARASRTRDALPWAVGAGVLLLMSLAEHTAVHERPDLLPAVAVDGPLLVLGGVLVLVMLPVAARLGGPPGQLVAAGAVLIAGSAVGGVFLARHVLGSTVAGSVEHVVVTHAAELGENLGALLVLVAAVSTVAVHRVDGGLRVRGRHPPGGVGPMPRTRRVAAVLLGVTAAISAASLVAVLSAPALGPGFRELRLLLDVLVEDNLPTWWSTTVLLLAALAHLTVAAVARAAGAPTAPSWIVMALLLFALSVDDHTALHERTEVVARRFVDPGTYPFAWLVPGLAVGAVVAGAVVLLALGTRGRTRTLLCLGTGLLLACALGLEFAQGLLMQVGDEGTGFTLLYHVEELGENVAAIMLLGAAGTALSVSRSGGALGVRFTASPARDG